MNIDIDADKKREMENWPKYGALTQVIIGSAPKQKRVNLYLAGGKNKAMYQLTEEQAKYLIETLSKAVDDIAHGVQ